MLKFPNINHPETVIAVIFSLSLRPMWATLGKNCLASVQRDCNLENKSRKLRWDGFWDGVAATLPELSEWTEHEMLSFSIRKEIIENENSLVDKLSKVGENEFLQTL